MSEQSGIDHAIAEIARRQGGVISYKQLIALGCERWQIHHRVKCGRLHRLHRGVYAVGHRVVGVAGRRWAAVLAYLTFQGRRAY